MESGHDVGTNLKRFREEAGLSQEELMQRADVHRTLISEYERGKGVPKLETLERLARALAVPLDRFFADVGRREPPAG